MIVGLRLAVMLGAGLMPMLAACDPFESKMVAACETAIGKRLLAPSTYKRVDISSIEQPGSYDLYTGFEQKLLPGQQVDSEDLYKGIEGNHSPKLLTKLITYDAANAMGVPIRGIAKCEFFSPDGDESNSRLDSMPEDAVLLDGQSYIGWLIDQAKGAH